MNQKYSSFLFAGVVLLLGSESFASYRQVLRCAVEKNVDQILSVEVEGTDLEGQLVARTAFEKGAPAAESDLLRVSSGDLSDPRIFLFESQEFAIGITRRYLERNPKTGKYSISHYFQCDWIYQEEKCLPGSDFEFRGTVGEASCQIVFE